METPSRTLTADAALPARVARSYLRWVIGRPVWVAIMVFAGVGAAIVIASSFVTGNWTSTVIAAIWMVGIGVFCFGELPGVGASLGAALVIGSGLWLVADEALPARRRLRL